MSPDRRSQDHPVGAIFLSRRIPAFSRRPPRPCRGRDTRGPDFGRKALRPASPRGRRPCGGRSAPGPAVLGRGLAAVTSRPGPADAGRPRGGCRPCAREPRAPREDRLRCEPRWAGRSTLGGQAAPRSPRARGRCWQEGPGARTAGGAARLPVSFLAVFEQHQEARTQFVQTVAELATRPQNIEPLRSAREPQPGPALLGALASPRRTSPCRPGAPASLLSPGTRPLGRQASLGLFLPAFLSPCAPTGCASGKARRGDGDGIPNPPTQPTAKASETLSLFSGSLGVRSRGRSLQIGVRGARRPHFCLSQPGKCQIGSQGHANCLQVILP